MEDKIEINKLKKILKEIEGLIEFGYLKIVFQNGKIYEIEKDEKYRITKYLGIKTM
ncbi:MAG: DUF2292 domain-containing protein [Candidatus Thorarchaeota archaeon]